MKLVNKLMNEWELPKLNKFDKKVAVIKGWPGVSISLRIEYRNGDHWGTKMTRNNCGEYNEENWKALIKELGEKGFDIEIK